MIIGVTGKYCSGKDSVAEYLMKKGFQHYSLSDEIRNEAQRRKVTVTRTNLISLGNTLRAELGSNVLAEWVKIRLHQSKSEDFVITSIRNPEEVRSLQQERNFILVTVTADPKKRFVWIKKRNREEDPDTFAELMRKEKSEQSADPTKQQLHKVIGMATITIENDGSLDVLNKKVDKLISDLRKRYQRKRPTWDEYFMELADTIGKRGTCDRGRSGAVIVKDKRVLTTGYVGSPQGLSHCDEIGHMLKRVIHPDGSVHQHCVRTVHAEMNAILQAAKYGMKIEGATVYCKMTPCHTCAQAIINAGLKKVVCRKDYHGATETRALFKEAAITLTILDDSLEEYTNQ